MQLGITMSLLEQTVAAIAPPCKRVREQARVRLQSLAMPNWALGRLMELAESMAAMAGDTQPAFARRISVVMVGDHGVVTEGVSHYPQAITRSMVETILNGRAAINALAETARSRVVVIDMGVIGAKAWAGHSNYIDCRIADGTANIAEGPAMNREQARASIEAGIRVAQSLKADLYGIGEMGIGNTTPATAVGCALLALCPKDMTGCGTGIVERALRRKREVIERALRMNRPNGEDGLDVLHKVGGFEIGGMAGLMLGAAAQRKPIILDGLISTAAALLAQRLCPAIRDWMLASHRSTEPLHAPMLAHLGLRPYLDLELRLGEGTGAALLMPLIDSACLLMQRMSTLDEVVGR